MMTILRRVGLGALLLTLVAAPLAAQDVRERRSPEQRQEMERRARAQMSRMIRSELGLSEEAYAPVATIMERFSDQRRSLARAERELRRDLEAVLEEEEQRGTDAGRLLARLVELREREAVIFREEQEALLEVLTPTQVLQLHALRERISRRIRELRGRRGDREGDRGVEAPWLLAIGGLGNVPSDGVSI